MGSNTDTETLVRARPRDPVRDLPGPPRLYAFRPQLESLKDETPPPIHYCRGSRPSPNIVDTPPHIVRDLVTAF